jgi:N4-gp56 family major capsid protein
MADINTGTIADSIKTMYEKRLMIRALPRLVHSKWARRATLNKFGAYELRKFGSMSVITSALTEGVTPQEQDMVSITKVTMSPNWYGSWIGYTDKMEMEAFDPVLSEISGVLGEQAGLSADTLVRNALIAGATVDYSGGAAGRSSLDYPAHEISYADLVYQSAALDAENARPAGGSRWPVILHPHSVASLFQDEVFVNMFVQEADPIRNGKLGTLLNMDIYISSNAAETADAGDSSTTDVYHALFIGEESYGTIGMAGLEPTIADGGVGFESNTGKTVKPVTLIVKDLGSGDDPLNQRGTVAWKMTLNTSILNSAWIRDLEHVNVFSDD